MRGVSGYQNTTLTLSQHPQQDGWQKTLKMAVTLPTTLTRPFCANSHITNCLRHLCSTQTHQSERHGFFKSALILQASAARSPSWQWPTLTGTVPFVRQTLARRCRAENSVTALQCSSFPTLKPFKKHLTSRSEPPALQTRSFRSRTVL